MSKVVKSTMILMIVTMVSKVLGFIRETVLMSTHGAGIVADAYITSTSIPTVIFATVGAALGTTFIPLYFEVKKDKGDEQALKFANNVFNIVIILSIILTVFGFIFAEPLIKIFAMKFEGEKLILATKFTRIMILGVIFIALSNIMTCWLQVKGKFAISGMIGVPYNIAIILSILISSNGNINIMAIGTVLAFASQFLLQYVYAIKNNFKHKLYINLNDEKIKKMLYLTIPVFIGVGVNQLNAVVDRSLASSLGDGIISVLNSANKLNNFVQGLFIASIAAVIYPTLSKLSSQSEDDMFKDTIVKSLNSVIILIVPISIGTIILAKPIVSIVFERGKFNSGATDLTAIALIGYSIGMIGFALRDILNKVFYSLKDTKTPMINGALAMGLNIILNIILIRIWGHFGLAIATSISSIICIVLLFNSLSKKIGYFGQKKIVKTLVKTIVSAGLMGIFTYYIYAFLINTLGSGKIINIISLFITVGSSLLIYFIALMILRIEEISIIINLFKNLQNKIVCSKVKL